MSIGVPRGILWYRCPWSPRAFQVAAVGVVARIPYPVLLGNDWGSPSQRAGREERKSRRGGAERQWEGREKVRGVQNPTKNPTLDISSSRRRRKKAAPWILTVRGRGKK